MNYTELELAGMDMKDLMTRLMNNEKLIGLFVNKFMQDKTYDALVEAINVGDMTAAEHAVHTLKGVSGNLSLKNLFALSQEQLRLFRSGESEKAVAMMGDITQAYETAIVHMKAFVQQ